MSETLEMQLDAVNEWITKETITIIKPLRADAKKILKENQAKLEELHNASNKLLDDAEKEMAKSSRKTYKRAKFLYKLAGTFSDLLEEVTIPDEINGKTLNETSKQIEKILKTINQEKTKWFRVISPYFIISRRRFDAAFKKADDSFQNYINFLRDDYVKAESAENVPSKIEKLYQSIAILNEYQMSKETKKQTKKLLEKNIAKKEKKLGAIKKRDEIIEFARLDAKIKELTKNLKHELRHIQKSLLKFQTLINSPGYSLSPEATSKLDQYLTNPFNAFATEKQGHPLLRSILQSIIVALDQKTMKLKPSRLRKAKIQINQILNQTSIYSLQKDCIKVFNKKHELSNSRTINDYRNERSRLDNHLKNLKRRKRLLEVRNVRFEKELKETLKRVLEQKKDLEKILSKLSNRNIVVLIN
jgi:hypothetical protein